MIFEYDVKLVRSVEEQYTVIMDAEDEASAEAKVRELVDDPFTTDVRARRYMLNSRHYRPIDEIEITPVEYEEPRYA